MCSRQGRQRTFNTFSERKTELDALLPEMPNWTIHDLRRTARSLMARAGVLPNMRNAYWGMCSPVSKASMTKRYMEEKAKPGGARVADRPDTQP